MVTDFKVSINYLCVCVSGSGLGFSEGRQRKRHILEVYCYGFAVFLFASFDQFIFVFTGIFLDNYDFIYI